MLGANLPQYLWCYNLPAILDIINNIAVINKNITPFQAFFDELRLEKNDEPTVSHYRIIGTLCDILIPPEKRFKSQKLAAKTQSGRLLAILSLHAFLIQVLAKKQVVKTLFIKLQEGDLINQRLITSSKEFISSRNGM